MRPALSTLPIFVFPVRSGVPVSYEAYKIPANDVRPMEHSVYTGHRLTRYRRRRLPSALRR